MTYKALYRIYAVLLMIVICVVTYLLLEILKQIVPDFADYMYFLSRNEFLMAKLSSKGIPLLMSLTIIPIWEKFSEIGMKKDEAQLNDSVIVKKPDSLTIGICAILISFCICISYAIYVYNTKDNHQEQEKLSMSNSEKAEVEDLFKAIIIEVYINNTYSEPVAKAMKKGLERIADKIGAKGVVDCKYEATLRLLSKESDDFAYLYKIYNSLETDFSDFTGHKQMIGETLWTAIERKSGLEVTYKSKWIENTLEVEYTEEEVMSYIERCMSNSPQGVAINTSNTMQEEDSYEEGNAYEEFAPKPITFIPYESSSNHEAFDYFISIMEEEFSTDDMSYLNSKYSPLVPLVSFVATGEYIGEEDETRIKPAKSVIVDLLTHHYGVPNYIAEYFAEADLFRTSNIHYGHLNANRIFFAYILCAKLVEENRFDSFLRYTKKDFIYVHPFVNPNLLEGELNYTERNICDVLNIFLSYEPSQDCGDGFRIFANYFDFIEQLNQDCGECLIHGVKSVDYNYFSNK